MPDWAKRKQAADAIAGELQSPGYLSTRALLDQSSADDIAGQLLDLSIKGLPMDEPVLAARRYVEMTAEQVQGAFKKWLRPDDFVQIVRGPRPE